MANLVKYTLGDPVFNPGADSAPLSSDWDISATSGNLDTSGTTAGKAGTGGSGSGIKIRVIVSATAISSITIDDIGVGYKVGDTITFSFTSADNGFIGNCDITLTPTLGKAFFDQSRFKTGYFDADKILAYGNTEDFGGQFYTNVKNGDGTSNLTINFAVSGVTPASQEMMDAVEGINEAFRDAWQNPKSIPSLNDYLPGNGMIASVFYG
tara:strand:- start:2540 stop:3169 length:630 start_codon:yes stop_codon:yes gene_type:complete